MLEALVAQRLICKKCDEVVDISTIDSLLWSKDYFISNIRLLSLSSDEESDDGGDRLTRSSSDRDCADRDESQHLK